MSWLSDKIESLDDPAAPTTPTRTLDTEFTPSATKWTLCSYVVQLVAADAATPSVELRSDSASPPTTARAVASLAPTSTGGSVTVKQTLTYLVPPGHKV